MWVHVCVCLLKKHNTNSLEIAHDTVMYHPYLFSLSCSTWKTTVLAMLNNAVFHCSSNVGI